MQTIEQVSGRGIPLLLDDIDTDRIIPARFLRCVTFEGLGEHAFEDDRKQDPKHPFDDARFRGARVLIVGRNFGCGSSREHAPQALIRWGIQAVVGESFAEIFFGNCTANGIPAVCASRASLQQLAATIESDPHTIVTVDLVEQKVAADNLSFPCTIQEGARTSLVTGRWDFLGELVEARDQVAATAARLPYLKDFAV
jgi:3-isopropylmalate/(R)-2-methylmalate dehydratase small subunit